MMRDHTELCTIGGRWSAPAEPPVLHLTARGETEPGPGGEKGQTQAQLHLWYDLLQLHLQLQVSSLLSPLYMYLLGNNW